MYFNNLRKVFLFTFIILFQSTQAQDSTHSIVFNRVEVEASFPGGNSGWRDYLMANLDPNVPVTNGAPAGTYQVIIRFIVGKDGSLSDMAAESGNGYGMEKECIRVIQNGPKWIPAMQNGMPVNAYRRQPVTFQVVEEKKGRKRKHKE